MASTNSRGAYGYLFALIFILLAAFATYELRLSPVSIRVGELLEPSVNSKFLKEYDNTELRYRYTGVDSIDFVLRFLVVAFLGGALGIDEGIKLQQCYFLLTFFPIVAIFSVEAGRPRNKRSLIYFTSIWALFYQTTGGAIIIPLYHLAYMVTTSSANYWSPASRAVSLPYAEALLPSLIIGYLVPTLLIYLPYGDVLMTQGFVALWQPAPIFVNILLSALSPPLSAIQKESKPSANGSTEDVKHLKRVYLVSFFVGAVSHWGTAALCLLTKDPNISFMHALWPNADLFFGRAVPTMSQGLHFIFQMDYWIIFASCLVWAYLATLDTSRAAGRSSVPPIKVFSVMALNTVLFGPGATVAAIWYTRESTLASLQVQQKKKKSKAK